MNETNVAELAPDDAFLKRAIVISVALHVAVVAAFTLRAVFYPEDLSIYEKAIRVDIVGLPDKVQTLPPIEPAGVEAPPTQKKPEPLPQTKPVEAAKPAPKAVVKDDGPKVNLDKTKREKMKREQDSALKRLEAMEKLERMMKDRPATTVASTGNKPQAQGAPIKGNAISHGSSLRGTARLDHENYKNLVDEHVHRHWNLPQWMANANFKARVLVFVDARGLVVKAQLTQPSGNQVFDERVMLAIQSASPFPPPPENLVDLLAVDGIEFGFPE